MFFIGSFKPFLKYFWIKWLDVFTFFKAFYWLFFGFIANSNLYEEDTSESGSGWIQWFCDLEGHEFFIEVDEDYIRDNFNLHGLRERVTYFT